LNAHYEEEEEDPFLAILASNTFYYDKFK